MFFYCTVDISVWNIIFKISYFSVYEPTSIITDTTLRIAFCCSKNIHCIANYLQTFIELIQTIYDSRQGHSAMNWTYYISGTNIELSHSVLTLQLISNEIKPSIPNLNCSALLGSNGKVPWTYRSFNRR